MGDGHTRAPVYKPRAWDVVIAVLLQYLGFEQKLYEGTIRNKPDQQMLSAEISQ